MAVAPIQCLGSLGKVYLVYKVDKATSASVLGAKPRADGIMSLLECFYLDALAVVAVNFGCLEGYCCLGEAHDITSPG